MENNFNFEIFEAPAVSEQEMEQKRAEKTIRQKKNNKKNLTIKAAGIITAVVLSTIAILCCYLFSEPTHNPEKLVAKYVNEINNGEWEKAYSRLYFDGASTVNKESFVNYCKENPQNAALASGKIIDYDIEKDTEDKYSPKSSRIFYSINYVLEDGSHGTFYLSAERINNKPGKFAKYGILPTQNCFASLKIIVPQATIIKVNGIEFSNPSTENNSSVYSIPYNFAQSVNININNPFCNDIEEQAELKPGSNTYNFSLEITEDCFNKLSEQTKEYITSLYTDIINGTEDFSKYPLSKAYQESGFNDDITAIKNNVFSGNYTISNFTVTEAEPKKAFSDIDKQLNESTADEIEIKYNFKYSYTASYNDEAGNPVSFDKTDSGYFTVKYVLENEWHISDISTSAWF